MKRIDLIRHLERNGCQLLREGNNHSVYVNRSSKRSPKHAQDAGKQARAAHDQSINPASHAARHGDCP